MGKIVILDENTSNKIAAGEVVERPASVVKELVENSIDAGANSISVDIRNGGISYLKVTDNGSGIDEDDVEIAFERHATSKIRSADDLESITTMGFRGEALASIASVSVVELTTRVQKNPHGTYIKIEGGTVKDVKQTGCPNGTTFIVRDLFYNTPARYKFLKKDSTEAGYISDIISRLALANPHISFRLTSGGSNVIHSPGNNDLLSVVYSIYGKETAKEVAEINYEENGVKITGFAGKPEISRANRNHQSLFINGRYIKSKTVTSAIDEAYKTYLLKNKFPFIILSMEINPLLIDINVHPTKMEVRFSNEQDIFRSVYHAITNALLGKSLVRHIELDNKEKNLFKFKPPVIPKENYSQQNIAVEKHLVLEKPNAVNISPQIKSYEKNIFSEKENNIYKENVAHNALVEENISYLKEVSLPVEAKEIAAKRPTITYNNKEETLLKVAIKLEGRNEKPANEKKEPVETVEENGRIEENNLLDEIKENPLLMAKIIGQAFSTYIILQHENELILIDQHAAHERIMYERLKEKYLNNESLSQVLIAPVVVELTHQELKLLENEREFFNKIGFELENFGNNAIIIRSIPYTSEGIDVKQLFLDVIDHIMNKGISDFKLVADDIIYTIACKAAVKANKRLDDTQIKGLISELSQLGNPFTCPHGRPTIIKITKYEIEKMFKRIV